jgi:hypothetical protein
MHDRLSALNAETKREAGVHGRPSADCRTVRQPTTPGRGSSEAVVKTGKIRHITTQQRTGGADYLSKALIIRQLDLKTKHRCKDDACKHN